MPARGNPKKREGCGESRHQLTPSSGMQDLFAGSFRVSNSLPAHRGTNLVPVNSGKGYPPFLFGLRAQRLSSSV
jgi:hypothetical protein